MSYFTNLIVQYYNCAESTRQSEINECLRQNLCNPHLDTIHLLTEEFSNFDSFPKNKKIRQTVIGERLTFERAFRYANEADPGGAEIWILANADIYFDDSLRLVEWKNLDGVVYALTRHDMQVDGSLQLVPPEYAHGCQDVWMFRTPLPLDNMFAAFHLGIAGCDHRIAYELLQAGKAVANPSLAITVRHLDLVRQPDIHAKTAEYAESMNEEGYRLGKVIPPPYLYCLYPSAQLVYPDVALLRHAVSVESKALQRENELQELVLEEKLRAAEFTASIAALKYKIDGLETQIAEKVKDLTKKDHLLLAHELRIGELSSRVIALEASLSWRITKPLRVVGQLTAKRREITFVFDKLKGKIKEVAGDKPVTLLLDFDLGGGSNLYTNNLINYAKNSSKHIVKAAYCYSDKYLKLTVDADEKFLLKIDITDYGYFFKNLVKHVSVDKIIVSQLVSWPNTLNVLKAISHSQIPYIVLIHDYFYICPNWTLFDYQDKYCEVPEDLQVCKKCLTGLRSLDIPISQHTNCLNLEKWRKGVGKFLSAAQNVMLFSNASRHVLMQAYPFIRNTVINEHCIPDVSFFCWKDRGEIKAKLFTIAVIGTIQYAKGRNIIASLLKSDYLSGVAIRLVVLGRVVPDLPENMLSGIDFVQHGEYERCDLGVLLEKYEVSVVLIPSLWPETFCFTASEAIMLGYPVVCFDLGAQGERVKDYNCGWVVTDPYFDNLLLVLKNIMSKPNELKGKSLAALSYKPNSSVEHFDKIV